MINGFDKCPNCFEPREEQRFCGNCGFDIEGYAMPENALPPGTVLEGKYVLGRTLGMGGFGITYLGWDNNLDTKIAIKEYFPGAYVFRNTTKEETKRITITGSNQDMYQDGLKRYVVEAKNLSKFYNLPGIVSVKDFFYANDTAYMVMEYVDGITLKAYLKENGGKMDEQTVLTLMKPIIESLQQVHERGLVHRDISPDNIMVNKDGKIKLIDFGSVRGQSLEGDKTYTVILKHGYAPQEQYYARGKQGPWTDVYSLCATMYKMLTGNVPPNSIERMSEDTYVAPSAYGVKISPNTEQVLNKGLSSRIEERYQDLGQLKDALYNGMKPVGDTSEEATMLLNNQVPQQQMDNTVLVNHNQMNNQMNGQILNQNIQPMGWGNQPQGNMMLQQPVQQSNGQQYNQPKKKNFVPIIIGGLIAIIGIVVAVMLLNRPKDTAGDSGKDTTEGVRTEDVIIDDTDDTDDTEVTEDTVAPDTEEQIVDNNPITEEGTLSDNWTDYQAQIGDYVYHFPMTYDDFAYEGWDINNNGAILAPGEIREFTATGDVTDFGILVANYYSTDMMADDCHVIGIRVNTYWHISYEDAFNITLPGGVCANLVESQIPYSEDEVIGIYGYPDYEDDFDYKQTYVAEDGFLEFGQDSSGNYKNFMICSLQTPEGCDLKANVDSYEKLPQYDYYSEPSSDTTDRFDAVIKLDGINYQLPVPVEKLLDDGWKFAEGSTHLRPMEQQYTEMTKTTGNGTSSINVYLNNPSIYNVKQGDTMVDYIYVSSYEYFDDIVIPGNISFGTSLEDVEVLFTDVDDSYKYGEEKDGYYQYEIMYPVYDGAVRMTYFFEPDDSGVYRFTDGYYWRDTTSAVTDIYNTDYINGYTIQ